MTKLRSNCVGAAPPASVGYYAARRIFYNQLALNGDGDTIWAQPEIRTPLLVADSDSQDPAYAHVSLHALTCVRQSPGGAGAIAFPNDLNTNGLLPPQGTELDPAAPLVPPLAVNPFTTGRGSAAPQYRVEFRDGESDGQVLWVDGSSTLVLPGPQVTIDLVTPVGVLVNPEQSTTAAVGLFVESEAAASVFWSSRSAGDAAPNGLATWTQTQLVTATVAGANRIMFFERPPFARTVRVVPAGVMVAGGVVALTARFVAGGTFDLGEVALGLAIGAQYALPPADHTIPNGATHIEITPRPALVEGLPVSVIWGIGV